MKRVKFYEEEGLDFLEVTNDEKSKIYLETYFSEELVSTIVLDKNTTIQLIEELKLQVAKLD